MKFPICAVISLFLVLAARGAVSTADKAGGSLDRYVDLPVELYAPEDPAVSVTFRIEVGESREHVLASCGRPGKVINPNLWVYANCQSRVKQARKEGCDTLLIAFANDRVIGMKLVNRAVLDAALAKSGQAARQVAATP